jgi:hypothetical protein
MLRRQAIVGLGVWALPHMLKAGILPQYHVGDLVEVLAIPPCAGYQGNNEDLRRHASLLRRCVGKRCRIIYIGEDGRTELDVTTEADPGVMSCSISLEKECIGHAGPWAA